MHLAPLGDQAILITLGNTIDEATHRLVRAAVARIDEARVDGVIDLVPAFASVAVHYDPARVTGDGATPYARLAQRLEQTLSALTRAELPPPRTVEIPVCYGGDLGPDLDEVARAHDMSAEDVVRLHSQATYLVYMVGFMPGFAYLGGLPEQIATPRRSSPRAAVPAGTVGIGGNQTGVYPLVSPGGWNLIGRTPARIFDITRDEPTLLATGDRVRFRPIARDAFDEWRE
ncbi:MAG TPA: 5-oxoprolinase subunit PxpB [Gemmatimonadaceae bacterium]|jgi:inhibitor of KinA|nr:5-oxoprolinase subunit PxpB [Gemmatimonadaceae bacterium]